MTSIIFWIIILYAIVKYKKIRFDNNGAGRGINTGADTTPNMNNSPASHINNAPPQHINNAPVQYYNPNRGARSDKQRFSGAGPNVQSTDRKKLMDAPPAMTEEPEAGSTMDYLEEKARQDAIEHAKEKHEEEMRLRKSYGGLRAAQRHYDGSAIPGDKRCIVCAYCGAENLVPIAARERYSCYFCREALK